MSSINRFPGGFCVLMAVYGRDKPILFEQAVQSVFRNTLLPDQCLIVVDGPISIELENSISHLQLQYPSIQLLRIPENIGLARALNEGIKLIKQAWVVRADADDINLCHRFSALANKINEQPNLQLLGSAILELDEFGKPMTVRGVPSDHNEIRNFAKLRNPFNHMTVAYRLDAVLRCGGYPNIYLKEDYGLWCQFLAMGFFTGNLKEILVHASAGREMFRRRGGFKIAKSEIELQVLLAKTKLKSTPRALIDGIIRAGFFLIPSRVRGLMYKVLLRNNIE